MDSAAGSWWKISIWVIVVAITLWFLFAVRTILLPFALAFIISILLEPVIQRLRRRGMSRPISVLLVISIFFVTVGVGFVTAVPKVTSQLTAFTTGLEDITRQLSDANEAQSVFTRWNPVVKAKPSNATQIDHVLAANQERLKFFGLPYTRAAIVRDYVEPHRDRVGAIVRGFFSSFVGLIGSAASAFLLLLFTPVFVALMLLDMDRMKRRSASWIPPSIRVETVSLMHDVGQVFLNYLRGVTTSILIWTLVSTVILSALGVPYSILLGLLFGAIYVIPYMGAFVMFLTVFLVTALSGTTGNAFVHFSDPWTCAVVFTVIFGICWLIYDSLINPRIVGNAVGLSPLVSFFVVFAGGALLGLAGMVLAYPIAGTVKVILSRILRVTGSATKDELSLPAVPLRHQKA